MTWFAHFHDLNTGAFSLCLSVFANADEPAPEIEAPHTVCVPDRDVHGMVASAGWPVYCVEGLETNSVQVARYVNKSQMLVMALSPHIGYDDAAKIAKKAHDEGVTLREAAIALGLLSGESSIASCGPRRSSARVTEPRRSAGGWGRF